MFAILVDILLFMVFLSAYYCIDKFITIDWFYIGQFYYISVNSDKFIC